MFFNLKSWKINGTNKSDAMRPCLTPWLLPLFSPLPILGHKTPLTGQVLPFHGVEWSLSCLQVPVFLVWFLSFFLSFHLCCPAAAKFPTKPILPVCKKVSRKIIKWSQPTQLRPIYPGKGQMNKKWLGKCFGWEQEGGILFLKVCKQSDFHFLF